MKKPGTKRNYFPPAQRIVHRACPSAKNAVAVAMPAAALWLALDWQSPQAEFHLSPA
jgi:hypothetical protein